MLKPGDIRNSSTNGCIVVLFRCKTKIVEWECEAYKDCYLKYKKVSDKRIIETIKEGISRGFSKRKCN